MILLAAALLIAAGQAFAYTSTQVSYGEGPRLRLEATGAGPGSIAAREVSSDLFILTVDRTVALIDLDIWTEENCVDRPTCRVRAYLTRGAPARVSADATASALVFTSDRRGERETRRIDCTVFAADDDHACLPRAAPPPMLLASPRPKSKSVSAPARPRARVSAARPQPRVNLYFANCRQARAAGYAPLRRGSPGYRDALDRDGDGKACE